MSAVDQIELVQEDKNHIDIRTSNTGENVSNDVRVPSTNVRSISGLSKSPKKNCRSQGKKRSVQRCAAEDDINLEDFSFESPQHMSTPHIQAPTKGNVEEIPKDSLQVFKSLFSIDNVSHDNNVMSADIDMLCPNSQSPGIENISDVQIDAANLNRDYKGTGINVGTDTSKKIQPVSHNTTTDEMSRMKGENLLEIGKDTKGKRFY